MTGGRFGSREEAIKAVTNVGLAVEEITIFKGFREELVLNNKV